MKLYGFELKKLGRIQKGFLILLVCLLLKLLFLCVFPEQKDPRILLSQKQYDMYLEKLHGENTPQKTDCILTDNEWINTAINSREEMDTAFQSERISQEEWESYHDDLNIAYLHQNASEIFLSKAEQFSAHPQELPPAHYIYEYGWDTIYTLQKIPDTFLLFAAVLMTAQCLPGEAAAGMLPLLLSARDGRRKLYWSKLLALLTMTLFAALISCAMEAAVFNLRGWCNDSYAPLYSISLFSECPLNLSLGQAYGLCMGLRVLVTLLFSGMLFGISVWIDNAANLIFTAICLLGFPLFLINTGLYFHGGLLCGSRVLLAMGSKTVFLPLCLAAAAICTAASLLLGKRRHQRGL